VVPQLVGADGDRLVVARTLAGAVVSRVDDGAVEATKLLVRDDVDDPLLMGDRWEMGDGMG